MMDIVVECVGGVLDGRYLPSELTFLQGRDFIEVPDNIFSRLEACYSPGCGNAERDTFTLHVYNRRMFRKPSSNQTLHFWALRGLTDCELNERVLARLDK